MQKLIGLRVENHKRVELVDITFPEGGGAFALMGTNESGKTSTLDALESTLAGRKGPKAKRPVHNGTDQSVVIATYSDVIVKRVTKASGGTQIVATNRDGLRHGKSEEVLEKLYSHIALDPLAFTSKPEQAQIDELLPLIGFDPKPLDEEHDKAYAARTLKNAEVKSAAARVAALAPAVPGTPAELVSVADLTEQHAAALGHNANGAKLAEAVESAEGLIAATDQLIEHARQEVTRLEAKRTDTEAALARGRAELAAFVAIDTYGIRELIDNAETVNNNVRAAQERARLTAEHAAVKAEWEALDARVTKAKDDKRAALIAASERMPVPGLSIDPDDGTLLLGGTAFADASSGIKMVTGMQIAAALNPELRLIIIRDASLLDAGNRELVDAFALEHEFLVLLELADTSGEVGVVLVDGNISEVRTRD